VASVAEVKAAIDAAMQHVLEGQQAVHAAVEGSGHESVTTAQAALAQASTELEDCINATLNALEQAQTYAATL
jgi:uncharacterized protein YukE